MRFLITAGPTREPIDPVRYITNRSSGKMGYALAEAALEAGHEVELISGPVTLKAPVGAHLQLIETAQEMFDAVAEAITETDVAIFCAAVADYRIKDVATEKIKKSSDELSLALVKNPDILGSARTVFGYTGFLVGFAAETTDLERHAARKLQRKQCDLLVANDVSRKDIGFDRDENEVQIFFPDGRSQSLPRGSKIEVARMILEHIPQNRT